MRLISCDLCGVMTTKPAAGALPDDWFSYQKKHSIDLCADCKKTLKKALAGQ